MKSTKFSLLSILILVMNISFAQETIYNNFGPGHDGWDYNYGLGWTIAGDSIENQYGVEQAMGFEATIGGFVTDIWVAISYVPFSWFADTVIIRLTENHGLPPDTAGIMEEWILTGFSSWSQWNTPIHLVGNNTSELHAGSSYWFWALAKEDTWTMWCMNENPALTCLHTIRRENEDWLPVSNETASAFRIDVSTGVGISSKEHNNEVTLLSQNYPNPFTCNTNISYSVGKPDHIRVVVFDMLGDELMTLIDEYQNTGKYTIVFDTYTLPSGIYYYSLQSGQHLIDVKKMNCVR